MYLNSLVWHGAAWCGMVRVDLVWYGMVRRLLRAQFPYNGQEDLQASVIPSYSPCCPDFAYSPWCVHHPSIRPELYHSIIPIFNTI